MDWSPDGARLYVGGRDKAVHVWDVGWNKTEVEAGLPDRYTYVGAIRWEASRGNAGEINAVAASPDGKFVAIGGNSARKGASYIHIADASSLRIIKCLPEITDLVEHQKSQLHHSPSYQVCSLAWTNDSKNLLSTDTGQFVKYWDMNTRECKSVIVPPSYNSPELDLFYATFVSPSSILYTGRSEQDGTIFNATIAEFDVKSNRKLNYMFSRKSKASFLRPSVSDVVANTYTFVDRHSGLVYLKREADQLVTINSANVNSSRVNTPYMASVLSNKLLLVAGKQVDGISRRNTLEIWETNKNRTAAAIWNCGEPFEQQIESLSESQDSNGNVRFAFANPDDASIRVYRLKQDAQKLDVTGPVILKSNLEYCNQLTVKDDGTGAVIKLYKKTENEEEINVVFSNDSANPGLSEQLPIEVIAGPLAMNEIKRKAKLLDIKPSTVPSEPEFLQVEHMQGNTMKTTKLRTNGRIFYNPPTIAKKLVIEGVTVAFVVAPDDNSNEIQIFSEPDGTLLRRLRDHTGKILDLGLNSSGTSLISLSTDRTIKIWNITDILALDHDAPANAFGADFEKIDGRVIINNIQSGSPISAKHVRTGTQVLGLSFADPYNISEEIRYSQDQSDIMHNFLSQRTVTNSQMVAFNLSTHGWINITPAWQPALTLAIAEDQEWVAYKPDGSFVASQARGAELLGILKNRPSDCQPRILNGVSIEERFRAKPEEYPAFNVFSTEKTRISPISLDNELENRPEIIAIEPITIPKLRNAANEAYAYEIQVQVRNFNPSAHSIAANMQLVPYKPTRESKAGNITTFRFGGIEQENLGNWLPESWRKMLSQGVAALNPINRFECVILADKEILDAQSLFVRGSSKPRPEHLRLSVVMVSCHDYDGIEYDGNIFLSLASKARETFANSLLKLDSDLLKLKEDPTGSFNRPIAGRPSVATEPRQRLSKLRIANWLELLNDDVTVNNIDRLRDALRNTLQNEGDRYQNVVLVYIGGHGEAVSDGNQTRFRLVPTINSYTGEAGKVEKNELTWEVFSKFAELDARVIFIISSCYSGQALEDAFYDVKKSGCMLISSSPSDAKSFMAGTDPGEFDIGEFFTMFLSETIDEKLQQIRPLESLNFAELVTMAAQKTYDKTLELSTDPVDIRERGGKPVVVQRPCFSPDLRQMFLPVVSLNGEQNSLGDSK